VARRLYSTKTSTSSPGTIVKRVFVIGGLSFSFAAAIIKANYDPVFKSRVNKYLPGFSYLADTAGSKWTDIFGRQKVVKKDRFSGFVYKQDEPKRKPDIGKIINNDEEEWEGSEKSSMKMPSKEELDTAQENKLKSSELLEKVRTESEQKKINLLPIESTKTPHNASESGSGTAECNEANSGKENFSEKEPKTVGKEKFSEPVSNPKPETSSSSLLDSDKEDNSSKEDNSFTSIVEVRNQDYLNGIVGIYVFIQVTANPSIESESLSKTTVSIEESKPKVVNQDPLLADPSEVNCRSNFIGLCVLTSMGMLLE